MITTSHSIVVRHQLRLSVRSSEAHLWYLAVVTLWHCSCCRMRELSIRMHLFFFIHRLSRSTSCITNLISISNLVVCIEEWLWHVTLLVIKVEWLSWCFERWWLIHRLLLNVNTILIKDHVWVLICTVVYTLLSTCISIFTLIIQLAFVIVWSLYVFTN